MLCSFGLGSLQMSLSISADGYVYISCAGKARANKKPAKPASSAGTSDPEPGALLRPADYAEAKAVLAMYLSRTAGTWCDVVVQQLWAGGPPRSSPPFPVITGATEPVTAGALIHSLSAQQRGRTARRGSQDR